MRLRYHTALAHESHRAHLFGGAHGVLDLAEDLRLAEHHRIETGGDAERVTHGLLARQRAQMRLQVVGVDAVIVGQPLERLRRIARRAIQLGAVAGGQDRGFARRPRLEQLGERILQLLGAERHALADGERRGFMVETEGEELHGESVSGQPEL